MKLKPINQKNASIKTPTVKTTCQHKNYCFSKATCANDSQLMEVELVTPSIDPPQLPPTSE